MDEASGLLKAQEKARKLLEAIEERGLVGPGISTEAVADAIKTLGVSEFGADEGKGFHWPLVRAGSDTLNTFSVKSPSRTIQENDIVFLDIGPAFDGAHGDFGRTYVFGDDPAKISLRDGLADIFDKVKAHFKSSPDITGQELLAFAENLAADGGWTLVKNAGHLVGKAWDERNDIPPHARSITPDNTEPLRGLYPSGGERHWMLEIHLKDEARQFGGFYEELLTVG